VRIAAVTPGDAMTMPGAQMNSNADAAYMDSHTDAFGV
jgi:hypothetical protein